VTEAIGVVAIGRNEGERLVRCLRSLAGRADAVVYVDSGSTDGSPARARSLGVDVVELDPARPFSAARARNEGFARLEQLLPELAFVQFVDGDCELQPGWIPAALAFARAHPEVAVVCGRRRERDPDASVWNRLVDLEWDRPPGDTDACGGDALMRAARFRAVGGYDASRIAGEDPELCLRIRRAGGRIVRLAEEMTLHDVALHDAGAWWRRQVRSGHAYAEAALRSDRDPHALRRLASIALWGGALPVAVIALALATRGAGLALALAWAWPWWRAHRDGRRRWSARDAALYASGCTAGKLAEFEGVLRYAWNHGLRGRATGLIEYKGP